MPATTQSQSESQKLRHHRTSNMPDNFTSHPEPLEASSKINMQSLLDKLTFVRVMPHIDIVE